jgi:hypothetical protein
MLRKNYTEFFVPLIILIFISGCASLPQEFEQPVSYAYNDFEPFTKGFRCRRLNSTQRRPGAKKGKNMKNIVIVLTADFVTGILFCNAVGADSLEAENAKEPAIDAQAQANNPLANMVAFNVQNY